MRGPHLVLICSKTTAERPQSSMSTNLLMKSAWSLSERGIQSTSKWTRFFKQKPKMLKAKSWRWGFMLPVSMVLAAAWLSVKILTREFEMTGKKEWIANKMVSYSRQVELWSISTGVKFLWAMRLSLHIIAPEPAEQRLCKLSCWP